MHFKLIESSPVAVISLKNGLTATNNPTPLTRNSPTVSCPQSFCTQIGSWPQSEK